ncbi:hypothetical protein [Teredinibacter turnerae]|uniref:hypothetical protein n=1 Tax=Teredinibacter turnerae TaxID=2426 RepID=UPI0012BC52E8|nr:hypothetical protein [Teredinibacter turnerae]
MCRVIILYLLLLANVCFAGSIEHDGVTYEVELRTSELNCDLFTVKLERRSLPFSIRESQIPYPITMGHLGDPYLISQTITYKAKGSKENVNSVESVLPKYSRVENGRKYVAKLGSCVGESSVTLSLWGGGNCTNVCEAWTLITFGSNGEVKSSKGLTYAEFKKYN